jgi:hypothetical protein
MQKKSDDAAKDHGKVQKDLKELDVKCKPYMKSSQLSYSTDAKLSRGWWDINKSTVTSWPLVATRLLRS